MTFPDGDSYVGEWKDGNMNGWGAYYWNNGNSYQVSDIVLFILIQNLNRFPKGRVTDGVMDGQALHFRWGDGSKFICEETKDCMVKGVMVKELGKFRGVNRSYVKNNHSKTNHKCSSTHFQGSGGRECEDEGI